MGNSATDDEGCAGVRMAPQGQTMATVAAVVVATVAMVAAAACGAVGSGPTAGDGPDGASPGSRPVATAVPTPRQATPSNAESDATAGSTPSTATTRPPPPERPTGAGVTTGADRLAEEGFARLSGLRVGLIANRASTVGGRSLIDLLHESPDVDLVAIFAPEHGLRADQGDGTVVASGVDPVTGVAVHSLYGDERAPTPDALAGLDVVVFDLQDVGARFYTYTATMGLAMQAAADAGLPFLVLDRPNPLGGDRVDGPGRDDATVSFVSMYPIPALHGLTVGELALAIRGEAWLDGLDGLDLEVVALDGWSRVDRWEDTGLTWVPPSPGLPTADTALLYPATVLLEGTTVSFGRGTDRPYAQVGAPWLDADALAADLTADGLAGVRFQPVELTPVGNAAAPQPRHQGRSVPGVRLEVTDRSVFRPMEVAVHLLHHVLAQAGGRDIIDRPDFFDLLAGRPGLRLALLAGDDPAAIVAGWAADLTRWESVRAPYLLY